MTYPEAIQYLESFVNYEKVPVWPYKESLKLERIKDFLAVIDNPQDSLKCIHVAGTKGKGSTCAFISYILTEAGYKVGLYTSPHLTDFRERIRIINCRTSQVARSRSKDFQGMISQNDLVKFVERLRPHIENYNQNSSYGPLSFFEAYTALSFVYFKEKKVDFAVLETGLGGRLDATNVVSPLVCAITPISYEHTQKLGNTLKEIATEKAGIIKARQCTPSTLLGTPSGRRAPGHQLIVITASQEEEALEVIRDRCLEVGAKLYEVDKDILYEKVKAQGLRVKGIMREYSDLKIRLLGEHQFINAAVAVGVIEALQQHNINVSADSIRKGLYNTVWPGRCEVIAEHPLVVLDGAQNVASARALKQAIKERFPDKRLILVLGISKDKDIKGICGELCPLAEELILTQANNPRAASVQIIEDIIRHQNVKMSKCQLHKTKTVQEARGLARSIAGKEDLVLVTGSLFVVGEARKLF